MAAQSASLRSYTARVKFDVQIHSFIDLRPTLHATYYFKKPDKAKLVFDSLPFGAEQFKNLNASLATPATWAAEYDVAFATQPASDGPWVLALVPKKEGNLERVLVTVDRSSYGVIKTEWKYRNGGTIRVAQRNERIGGYLLPRSQVADFALPSYSAHAVSSYDEYKINVDIPDSVFAGARLLPHAVGVAEPRNRS